MTDPVPSRPPLGRGKKLLFGLITLLFLGVLDITVRVSGLAEKCLNYNTSAVWSCDPILSFKLNPDLAQFGATFNRAGFRSREFTSKPRDVYRVLALGDSCTLGVIVDRVLRFVPEPYPQRLDTTIAARAGDGKVEVLNAGVAGYNSYHGVMLLRTKLRHLSPDLITVRYGWNDHLMSQGG